MKTIQLILIFAFISYCFTQSDECTTEFESRLQSKCTSIDTTCRFTDNENQRCLPKNSCGIAENDGDCRKIIPDNYHKKKFKGTAPNKYRFCSLYLFTYYLFFIYINGYK